MNMKFVITDKLLHQLYHPISMDIFIALTLKIIPYVFHRPNLKGNDELIYKLGNKMCK